MTKRTRCIDTAHESEVSKIRPTHRFSFLVILWHMCSFQMWIILDNSHDSYTSWCVNLFLILTTTFKLPCAFVHKCQDANVSFFKRVACMGRFKILPTFIVCECIVTKFCKCAVDRVMCICFNRIKEIYLKNKMLSLVIDDAGYVDFFGNGCYIFVIESILLSILISFF